MRRGRSESLSPRGARAHEGVVDRAPCNRGRANGTCRCFQFRARQQSQLPVGSGREAPEELCQERDARAPYIDDQRNSDLVAAGDFNKARKRFGLPPFMQP